LWFQRLALDLTPLAAAVRVADSAPGWLDLIATSSGWLLADLTDSLRVFALDPQGASVQTVIAQDQKTTFVDTQDVPVRLVAGANGFFVVWFNADMTGVPLYDAALSADGSTVLAQQKIGDLDENAFAATALGQGLLVVGRFTGQSTSGLFSFAGGADG